MIETPALLTLRRSFADSLLLEAHWRLPDEGASAVGELPLALRVTRLLDEALVAIWSVDSVDERTRRAWSDWLWMNLRAERFERIPQMGGEAATQAFRAQYLAFPLTGAFHLFDATDRRGNVACRGLIDWWKTRIFAPVVSCEPAIELKITATVAHVLGGSIPDDLSGEERRIWNRVQARFIQLLPRRIRDRLFDDRELMAKLGVEIGRSVSVEGRKFAPDEFWEAVREARSGRNSKLRSLDGKTRIRVFRTKGGAIRLTGGMDATIADDPAFGILDRDAGMRRETLKANPQWFDMSAGERHSLIEEIVAAPISERMARLNETRAYSVTWRLQQWRAELGSQGQFDPRPPAVADLLRHLRFDPQINDHGAALGNAVMAVLDELGPAEAVICFAGLPVPPSEAVCAALAALTPVQREAVLTGLATSIAGPIGRVMVLALMRRFGHPGFSSAVDELLQTWDEVAKAHLAALRGVEVMFEHDAKWRVLPGAVRLLLVWTHAHHLLDTLLACGMEPGAVTRYFEENRQSGCAAAALVWDAHFHGSAMHPDPWMSPAVLLFHGLGSMVGSEGAALLRPEHRQAIERMLHISEGEACLPAPGLLHDRGWREDPFGSFFSMRPEGIFASRPNIGAAEQDAAHAAILANFVERPAETNTWVLAWIYGSPLEVGIAVTALDSLDIGRLVASTGAFDTAALRMACRVAVNAGEDATRRLLDRLVEAASACAKTFRGPIGPGRAGTTPRPGVEAAMQLLECLAELSKRPDMKEAVGFLAAGLDRIGSAWPTAAPLLRHVAQRLYHELPFDASASLWRTWLRLRAEP